MIIPILILVDSLWMQLVYFSNTLSYLFAECLFFIGGTLTLTTSKCYRIFSVFSNGFKQPKFTAFINQFQFFYNWRIKSSKSFPRNHAVPGLFFKKLILGRSCDLREISLVSLKHSLKNGKIRSYDYA